MGWLRDEKKMPASRASFRAALSPEHATDDESAHLSALAASARQPLSGEKRQRLAQAVGRAAVMPDIEEAVVARLRGGGHPKQADEVVTARAFGAVPDRASDVVARLTCAVEPARGGVKVPTLVTDSTIKRSLEDLRSATEELRGEGERGRRERGDEPRVRRCGNSRR